MRRFFAIVLIALAAGPTVRAQGGPVRLSATEYRALNVFLSNFAEASLEPFRQGQLTDDAKIRFALQHVYWNTSGSPYTVTAARANELCRRYFGETIRRPRSGDGYAFSNGQFSTPPWDGAPRVTAHASDVRRLPSGEVTAAVDVYVLHELFGDTHDPYAQSAEQMRRFSQHSSRSARGAGADFQRRLNARMRPVTEQGRTRYVLLEWR